MICWVGLILGAGKLGNWQGYPFVVDPQELDPQEQPDSEPCKPSLSWIIKEITNNPFTT